MYDPLAILQGLIFFGSGLSLLMGVSGIVTREIDRVNILSFLLLTCNAIIMLNVGLSVDMVQARYPLTSFLFLTTIYAVGPLNPFSYHSLMDPEQDIPYKTRLHILPASVVFCSEVLFQFQGDTFKRDMIAGIFDAPMSSPFTIILMIGAVHVFCYLSYLSLIEFSLWNSREIRSEVRLMAGLNMVSKVTTIGLAAGLVLGRPSLVVAGGILLTFIHVVIFLASRRYPQFFQLLKREIKRKRYEKSLLSGVNTEVIYTRLMELMGEEELYKDMELNLKTVADLLAITPHQLSQFLNERINQDFRNFVNSFRVDEAKRQLAEHPDRGILEICFESGFNSKSTFNTVFKKQTGMTPREFRVNRRQDS